jgi:CO dehydrogenase/acetyl-CoA synthase gamma subunit (corrinoid Fe-S protein)
MPPPKNAMEIFKLLDMSNCRECGAKTCLNVFFDETADENLDIGKNYISIDIII